MGFEKTQRNTHQKALILKYIQEHGDAHIRAEDILGDLEMAGAHVGKATVYRFLKSLEEEGQIRRYTISDKVPACYQYIGDHPECKTHCHLMCSKCGVLLHVDNPVLQSFVTQTLENEGFAIDEGKTVFYGLCKTCRQESEDAGGPKTTD